MISFVSFFFIVVLFKQFLDNTKHFKSHVSGREIFQVEVVLLLERHQLVDHVVLMFIEEIPIHVLLHRDVKEVNIHELAVQS